MHNHDTIYHIHPCVGDFVQKATIIDYFLQGSQPNSNFFSPEFWNIYICAFPLKFIKKYMVFSLSFQKKFLIFPESKQDSTIESTFKVVQKICAYRKHMQMHKNNKKDGTKYNGWNKIQRSIQIKILAKLIQFPTNTLQHNQ